MPYRVVKCLLPCFQRQGVITLLMACDAVLANGILERNNDHAIFNKNRCSCEVIWRSKHPPRSLTSISHFRAHIAHHFFRYHDRCAPDWEDGAPTARFTAFNCFERNPWFYNGGVYAKTDIVLKPFRRETLLSNTFTEHRGQGQPAQHIHLQCPLRG
jgi:hypothetical protein